MENLYVKEILEATNGELLCGNLYQVISCVSTSSKQIAKNTLFVPIKGQKVDAHDFINDAFSNGAVASFTQKMGLTFKGGTLIYVKDTKEALQKLSKYYREKFNIPIIGVTGSVGKTTTKEMIAAALSEYGEVLKTSGNQNSQIGVPLTMFNIERSHKAAVIEMGMSEFNEMEKISQVVQASMAVITNIGISHIENLKTKENILTEKLHITDNFKENDILFLNGNDILLKGLKNKLNANKVYYGFEEFCDYRAENICTCKNETSFNLINKGHCNLIKIPTVGTHNVLNALVAISIADKLGLNIEQIKRGLLKFNQPSMRQTIHNLNNITLIDDSYNASPDSAMSGIDVMKKIAFGRTIAVLADMLELGEYSKKAHFDLGKYLASKNIDIVITIGSESVEIINGVKDVNRNILTRHFNSNSEAFEFLKSTIKNNDTIIVKGSRGMHMDEIVNKMIEFYN